jgi:hypothetical protein
MPKPPSVDLATASIQLDGNIRHIEEFTVKELKDELVRRGNSDFSKWDVWIKLSPFILLLAMGVLWKAGTLANGSYLTCLFQ